MVLLRTRNADILIEFVGSVNEIHFFINISLVTKAF